MHGDARRVSSYGRATSSVFVETAVISEYLTGEPIGMPDPPVIVVVAAVLFVVGANVCYTGGWIGELLVRRAWPDESTTFGTLTFTLGLLFAVVVTLTPAVLTSGVAVPVWLARWLGNAGP